MKRILTPIIALSISTILFAQTPTATITTWKNDASGAYNIIHDDFGDPSVDGIIDYVDTIHSNRGLKFTFGAITSMCEQRSGVYNTAKNMIAKGHEIINHSHTHSCAVANQNCGGTGVNYAWAESKTLNFTVEVDQSTSSIANGTGMTPRFFIFPYDQFNTTANNYLKSKGYIGDRTGDYNAEGLSTFAPDAQGYFRTPLMVDVVQNNSGDWLAQNLNYWVDQAIANKSWVNRELHNVGSTGWGHVELVDYINHINYVKQKVDAGQLWAGTISEILTYQIQKLKYGNPTSSYNSNTKTISLSWASPSFNVANYLANLQVKSPVTIKVDLKEISTTSPVISQNNKIILGGKIKNGFLYFDAYPHEGAITIQLQNCTSICISSQPTDITVNETANTQFSITASSATNTNLTYQWYKNNSLISGATSATLSITNALAIDSGSTYFVKLSAENFTSFSDTVMLSVKKKVVIVNNSKPYNNTPQKIPGKLEFENYDLGGQGIAYNDIYSDPTEGNIFRNDDVDIEACNDAGGGYNLSYTVAGEWVIYTIDIETSGNYTFDLRYANQNNLGQFKIYINDTVIFQSSKLQATGSWTKWATYSSPSSIKLHAGFNQKLKFEILGKDANYNNINFKLVSVTGYENEAIENIRVYPNPSQTAFHFKSPLNGTFEISTLDGKIKENGLVTSFEEISVGSNLESGIYLLKIQTDYGTQIQKIIKL